MSGILTVVDCFGESLLGLTEKSAELARARGLSVTVLCFCPAITTAEAGMLKAAGARRILCAAENPKIMGGERSAAEALAGFIRRDASDAVLFLSSVFTQTVAPMTAALLHCGLTADCTALAWEERGGLMQTRPTFGGTRAATVVNRSGPVLATVRKGVFLPTVKTGLSGATVEAFSCPRHASVWIDEQELITAESTRLSDAKVILSAGLGIGSAENFGKLCRLAEKIGASVGASRAAVAAGFAPASCQIGQTGLSVRPDIYCAFGISGAVQHLSGITGAGSIFAVNRDPNAPIHQYSDISVISDCAEVLDCLFVELSK